MISVASINLKGEKGEKIKLPEAIFGVAASPRVIAQAARVYLSNQREGAAKTKTRGAVKKTTAKMYRQKGTGRARHGSYSAPIFVGGGISHGPDGRQNYKRRMSTTLRRLALFAALSSKVKDDMVIISNGTKIEKTKQAVRLVSSITQDKDRLLLVAAIAQKNLARAARNLPKVTVIFSNQLNTFQIIANKKLVMTAEALNELSTIYAK